MNAILSFIKSNSTVIIISVIGIIIIIGIIWYFNREENKLRNEQNQNNFPLKFGSRGAEVEILQAYLNSKGEALIVDGIWGERTEEAVKRNFGGANEISLSSYNSFILGLPNRS